MIRTVTTGNLLESSAQTLANTVNCVGVMGKGIALQFKRQYPAMFADYAQRCARGEVRLGQPYLYTSDDHPWILNFPTKQHWRNPSHLEDIERGLAYLVAHVEEWEIASLAMPPLGCGNGGLDWSAVEPLLVQYLDPLAIPVDIYAPHPVVERTPEPTLLGLEHPDSI